MKNGVVLEVEADGLTPRCRSPLWAINYNRTCLPIWNNVWTIHCVRIHYYEYITMYILITLLGRQNPLVVHWIATAVRRAFGRRTALCASQRISHTFSTQQLAHVFLPYGRDQAYLKILEGSTGICTNWTLHPSFAVAFIFHSRHDQSWRPQKGHQ